jgi:HEPN domain-containing protein
VKNWRFEKMKSKQEVIKYWLTGSKEDFDSAEILYKNKKYHHALFFCHLSIEKMVLKRC